MGDTSYAAMPVQEVIDELDRFWEDNVLPQLSEDDRVKGQALISTISTKAFESDRHDERLDAALLSTAIAADRVPA